MRILTGQLKGKQLFAGNDLSIRPMTNRIKEIIFSILSDFCTDKIVLDLFSGSGSLGIEALSRGAEHATFVEKVDSSIWVLEYNIEVLSIISEKVTIVKSDVLQYVRQQKNSFDIILMDPPFHYPPIQELVDLIIENNILKQNGILVVHHEINNPLLIRGAPYELIKQKKIDRSLISIILQEENNV